MSGGPWRRRIVGLFVFCERAAERGCFVRHLGVEIGGELAEEIPLPRRGQIAAHSVEITIELKSLAAMTGSGLLGGIGC